MYTLYPAIKPYDVFELPVGDGHSLYVEQSGMPDGVPVVVIHGGPGAGCGDDSRRYFDPNHYRIICFDQRGSGRSTPHASIENNTTAHLIQDLETIRQNLSVRQWMLFGGSWGSTLALLYAQQYPQYVTAMILRGVWLLRQEDIDWMYGQHGARKLFPEHWDDFVSCLPENKRHDVVSGFHAILTGTDELARMSAAKAWGMWEARCATLEPNPELVEKFTEPHTALSFARICNHYVMNKGFIHQQQIMDNMKTIQDIPACIIHGRYDAICPAENAWTLHKAWPKSELLFVRDAGHSATELPIIDALVHATQLFAK